MILAAWIKIRGGLWAYRSRVMPARGVRGKARVFIYKRYLDSLGGYISLLAEFDGPPKFPHRPMGVFIAPGAVIGRDVTIFQQVTIGKNDTPGSPRFGAPTIGNGVYIGAGAKIIGRVTVGAGARIGAGAIVVKDVPPGATAVSPAALIVASAAVSVDKTL